jgi:hypothetical protein
LSIVPKMYELNKILRYVVLPSIFTFTFSICAVAEDITSEEPESSIESVHRHISNTLSSSVASIDEFFADDRLIEGDSPRSRARIRAGVKFKEGGSSLIASGTGQFKLPHLSESVQILLEGSSDEQFEDEDKGRVRSNDTDSVDFAGAGVRLRLYEQDRFQITHDTGFKFTLEPKFFSRLRCTTEYGLTDEVIFRPTQLLFFDDSSDQFGETTRIDFDWQLSADTLTRSRTEASYREESNGVEFFEEFSYFRQLEDSRGIGAKVGLLAESDPSFVVTEYRTSLMYRQKLWQKWLVLQAEPFLQFTREDEYSTSAGFILFLEVVFGDIFKL